MQRSRYVKKYFWEVCKFMQCDSTSFKEMEQPSRNLLYLYKENIPQIVIRLHHPTQKIHGWVFSEIEILQKLNENPCVSHWKSVTLPFRGQLILTLLPQFKKRVNQEIELNVPRKTDALQRWMRADLIDVFLITQRTQQSFGNEHTIFQIKTLYRTRYINYFQLRSWKSNAWEGLLQIAETEKIMKNSSYGNLLQEVNGFINSFSVIREEKYTNMFDIASNRKSSKRVPPRDQYQQKYQKKVLQKYRLYEYM